jgi:hypothetical protein
MRRRQILPRLVVTGVAAAAIVGLLVAMRGLSRDFRVRANLSDLGADFDKFESPPFVVYTSLSMEASKSVANDLSEFIHAFVGGPGGELGLRPFESEITLFLFPDVPKLQQYYQRTRHHEVFNLAGFYDPSSRVIALPGDDRGSHDSSYHEAVHLCVDAGSGAKRPEHSSWIDEGLATYFARSVRFGDAWSFGGVDPEMRDLLRDARRRGEAPRVRNVLDAGATEFTGPSNRLYYATSHLVVAWVYAGDAARRRAFADVVRLERLQGPCGSDALPARLQKTLDGMEHEISSWIDSPECR